MTRTCVIVGVGEGLGAALALRFAREGFDLVLISRSETGVAAIRTAVKVANPSCVVDFHSADVTVAKTVERALSDVQDKSGPVDVLIYNVRGSFTECEPLEITVDALETVYRQEVVGAFVAAKAVLPRMRERKSGTIMFSSATAAFRGSARHPLYAIGKFGLRALSQSLAKAYSQDGVHIVHVRLDCDLDVPVMREIYGEERSTANLADPHDVAESYWLAFQQPKGAWSNEIEIRPSTETWTY